MKDVAPVPESALDFNAKLQVGFGEFTASHRYHSLHVDLNRVFTEDKLRNFHRWGGDPERAQKYVDEDATKVFRNGIMMYGFEVTAEEYIDAFYGQEHVATGVRYIDRPLPEFLREPGFIDQYGTLDPSFEGTGHFMLDFQNVGKQMFADPEFTGALQASLQATGRDPQGMSPQDFEDLIAQGFTSLVDMRGKTARGIFDYGLVQRNMRSGAENLINDPQSESLLRQFRYAFDEAKKIRWYPDAIYDYEEKAWNYAPDPDTRGDMQYALKSTIGAGRELGAEFPDLPDDTPFQTDFDPEFVASVLDSVEVVSGDMATLDHLGFKQLPSSLDVISIDEWRGETSSYLRRYVRAFHNRDELAKLWLNV